MGRGRGRGRGKASVTAAPVASATYPSGAACFETIYNGVNSAYTFTDAALESTTSDIFMCGEMYLDSTIGGLGVAMSNFSPAATDGMQVLYVNSTDLLVASVAGSTDANLSMATHKDKWVRFMCIYSPDTTGKTTVYIDSTTGVQQTATAGPKGVGNGFTIGRTNGSGIRYWKGRLRNLVKGEGTPTNPTSFTPSDPTTITGGVTITGFFYNGNGTNDEGFSGTTLGTPVETDCT